LTAASIDHLVSLIIFVSAIMLFIGMFSQVIQTGVDYQLHRAVSSKASDMIDNMLLSPGIPTDWSIASGVPEGFGLQATEYTQYKLSPFSLMRLSSSTGTPVTYAGQTYSNITMGFGQSLLVPFDEAVNYSTASRLLGINGSYGFSLTLTQIVNTVITTPTQSGFSVSVAGPGFPLANAMVTGCLIVVEGGDATSPTYTIRYDISETDDAGMTHLSFQGFDGTTGSYALITCAHLSGLVGIGYHEHVSYDESYVIPFVSSFADKTAILAHSWDVTNDGDPNAEIYYKAVFMVLAEDYTFREVPFVNQTGGNSGMLTSGQHPDTLTIGTYNPEILLVPFGNGNAADSGIVAMPWGLSSSGVPVTFGGATNSKDWIATDIRQVMVNGIAYQAKLSVWSLNGYQVNG
jgi:hypothetical protein